MPSIHPELRKTLGWCKPAGSRVFHAFCEGVSLCGKAQLRRLPPGGLSDGPDESPSNCYDCSMRIAAVRRARREHCRNCRYGLNLKENGRGQLIGTCARGINVVWLRGAMPENIERSYRGQRLSRFCSRWAPSILRA